MTCTFDQLKTHIRHRTNLNFWNISGEEENKISLSNKQVVAFNHYEACHALTEQMRRNYGGPKKLDKVDKWYFPML